MKKLNAGNNKEELLKIFQMEKEHVTVSLEKVN